MRRLALTALAAAAVAVAPAARAATPEAAFGLRAVGANAAAGYFVYTTGAGTTRTGTVMVSNSGTAKGTVRLYTADGGTGSTTGTTYLTDAQPQNAGSWIALSKTSVTLAPGKSVRVPFTVEVPRGTPAGQHVGGIVAETTNQHGGTAGKGKSSVRIKTRDQSIMAVQVNVPGVAIHRFTIGKVRTGGANGFQQVIVEISNRGNVLERPTGSVSIYDGSAKLVQTLTFTMDTFLPQTSIDFPIELKKGLPAGKYSAAVTLHYALGSPTGIRTATERPSLTVTPRDVRKVFTSATPTLATPTLAAATTTRATASTTSTGGSSSGTSPVVYVAAAAVAVLLLLLILFVVLRRRGPTAVVTIPAPTPRSPTLPPLPVAPAAPAPAPAPEPAAEAATPADDSTADPGATADHGATADPGATLPPAPAPEQQTPAAPTVCEPYHYWEVDYDTGVQGADGVWRFPHRCKSCGLDLLARDVTDASEQADARR